MLKLVTGSPGDGKTSNELWDFLHAPQYANRPKYCTPINGFEPEKHGVKPIDHISCWQDLPEGAVIFCDEVQDFAGTDLPKVEPEWVKQLARHRHSGKDFIFTTQSPMFLHSFVRKLAKPHVHYTRPWNMKGVRYSWESVQADPNTTTARKSGVRTPVKPNPEVFKLYTSTVLDTHKSRPPYKVFAVLGVAILVLLIAGIYAFTQVRHMGDNIKENADPNHTAASNPAPIDTVNAPNFMPSNMSSASPGPAAQPVWTTETIKPRIVGMPQTAPIYDQLTAPTDFPRVAACMSSQSKGCHCYSQQATPLDIPETACEVFIKVGTFDPWLSGRRQMAMQGKQNAGQAMQPDRPLTAQATNAPQAPREPTGVQLTIVADSSNKSKGGGQQVP